MSVPTETIRPAKLQDALALAELVNMAGEGLPFYVWAKMAPPGEDPWQVGRSRASREEGSFSYRNAWIIEASDGVAACLVGYPLSDEPEPTNEVALPTMFAPLQQLENLAPGTWYVNVLACYPRWRNRGYASSLLEHAETLALAAGVSNGMSVIVADNNVEARRLYQRFSFREVAQRPMIKEAWDSTGSAWILLAKDRAAPAG